MACAVFIAVTGLQAGTAGAFDAPDDGGPRRLDVAQDGVVLRTKPEVTSAQIASLAKGRVLENLGCDSHEAQIWCAVRPLGSRTRGFLPITVLVHAKAPDGTVPMGPDDSAERAAAGAFDAEGTVPCAQIRNAPKALCQVGVARSDGQDATAIVTFDNGFQRILSFSHGRFISGNPTMSGTGYDTDWRIDAGTVFVRVDDQSFEIPVAPLFWP